MSWKCLDPDGSEDHDWQYKQDYIGDCDVINGTMNIYFRICCQCGKEESVASHDLE